MRDELTNSVVRRVRIGPRRNGERKVRSEGRGCGKEGWREEVPAVEGRGGGLLGQSVTRVEHIDFGKGGGQRGE